MEIGKEKERVEKPGRVKTLPAEKPIEVPNWPKQPVKVPVKTE